MKAKRIGKSVLVATVALAAAFALPGTANATWSGPFGDSCRDTVIVPNSGGIGVNGQINVCVAPSATFGGQNHPHQIWWDAQTINVYPDSVYVSLWHYNGPGSATFTGVSRQLSYSGNWALGSFGVSDCDRYLVGIGYWKGGSWHGTWQSPPAYAC
ncbi:hypothetical protein ACIRPK_11475 [Kitasatospora sp. NPDC101801]|uniref:hypothetical protein n=1 Tax=Kitasatospora sp. NPDC101801 TaxID=3364103 RepID=UPI0038216A09